MVSTIPCERSRVPSLVPLLPAIAAAIHDATGVWLTEQPFTPERVLAAIATAQETDGRDPFDVDGRRKRAMQGSQPRHVPSS
jgi:hypothetical protein